MEHFFLRLDRLLYVLWMLLMMMFGTQIRHKLQHEIEELSVCAHSSRLHDFR